MGYSLIFYPKSLVFSENSRNEEKHTKGCKWFCGFAIRRNSKPLSKILFTLHRKGINICNLETCTGEVLTPLFTHSSPGAAYRKICVNLWNLWDIKKRFQPPTEQGELPIQFRAQSEGEEWWRVVRNSSPLATPVFIGVSADLVKSEE